MENTTDMSVIVSCRHCGTKNKIDKDKAKNRYKLITCGNCKKNLFFGEEDKFSEISSISYEHPLDKKALKALKKIPGVKSFLKWILKETNERYMRMFQFQNYIQITENHLGNYYEMVAKACEILDIKKIPQTFVYQDPIPNAYTIGVEEPTIALSTGLIDLMDDDEVLGVISHEIGHIHSGHILYKTAARLVIMILEQLGRSFFGLGNVAMFPIIYALLYWDRCSELTADRIEMIVLKEFDKCAKIIMKLAGGSQKLIEKINTKEFLKQADEAAKMKEENFLNRIFIALQTMNQSHPFPIWRAGHLHKWSVSDELIDILKGDYTKKDADEKNKNESDIDEEFIYDEEKFDKNNTDEKNKFKDTFDDFMDRMSKFFK